MFKLYRQVLKIVFVTMTILLTIILSGSASFAGETNLQARIDVVSTGGTILIPVENCIHPQWLKDELQRPGYLTASSEDLSFDKWNDFSISFEAEKSCSVNVQLRANGQGNQVYFDDIRVEGATLKNGDFELTEGRQLQDWNSINSIPRVFVDEKFAASGKNVVKVLYEPCTYQFIPVEKGQKVTIHAKVRAARPEAESSEQKQLTIGETNLQARIDVVSTEGTILIPVENCIHPQWLKDELQRPGYLTGSSEDLSFDKWNDFSISFEAEKSCSVNLQLRSAQQNNQVYFDDIRVEGATLKNGDFELTEGRQLQDWNSINSIPRVFVDEKFAASGKNVVKVLYEPCTYQFIPVTKGQKVTIHAKVRAARPEAESPEAESSKRKQLTIDYKDWQLDIEPDTGDWIGLKYKGIIIASNKQQLPSVDLKLNDKWLSDSSPFELVDYTWDKAKAMLTLKIKSGDWRIDEFVQFNAQNRDNRLARSARLTYAPSAENKTPAKFFGFNFNYYLPKEGDYFFPGTFFKDNRIDRDCGKWIEPDINPDYRRRGHVSQLPTWALRGGYWKFWPVMVELNPENTLLFMDDRRQEAGYVTLNQLGTCIRATSYFNAVGWAEPGITQSIGPTYLEMCPYNAEQALEKSVARLYSDIGVKVPSDRPEWIYDAAMYVFAPTGNQFGDWDLGGFKSAEQSLIPRIADLGFNSVWIQPVQDGIVPYLPRDYYKMRYEYGTAEEYKELVQAAQHKGIKVLQDIVLHGGDIWSAKYRGDSVFRLIFDEQGNLALPYGRAFDFADPVWQQQIAKMTDYFMKDYHLDGVRVDAPGGNPSLNWRRRGFPAADKIPEPIDKAWWEKCLKEEGGIVPPLPYERASMGQVRAGLDMLRVIRGVVKKSKPESGVVLAENDGAPLMQYEDMEQDSWGMYDHMSQKMRTFSYDEYAPLLAQWLEEEKLAEPPGILRLRWPTAHTGWIGVEAARAMTTIFYLIDGVPGGFRQNKDIGNGCLVKKLNEIRKAVPELRRGEAFYQSVKSSEPCVFTVLRILPGKSVVGLVNLSPNTTQTTLTLPMEQLTVPKKQELALWNVFNGERLGKGKIADFQNLKIDLSPWESAVLVWLPSGTPCPTKNDHPANPQISQSISKNNLSIDEQSNMITVRGDNYSLRVNRATGLMDSFTGSAKSESANSMDLVFGYKPDGKEQKTKVEITRNSDGIIIKSTIAMAEDGTVTLSYNCSTKNVKIKAELSGFKDERNAGILFASPGATRFQINTAEGLLDDWYSPQQVRAKTGWPVVLPMDFYRTVGSAVIWQAETCPLSLSEPAIRMFTDSGYGTQFYLDDPVDGGLDNCVVMDKFGTSVSLHTGFFWKQPGAVVEDGKTAKKEFSVTLSAFAATPPPLENQALNIGKLKLSNESLDWAVENEHYRVRLRRTGGCIRDIRTKQQKVLENQDIITEKGFVPSGWGAYTSQYFAVSRDVETGVKIRRDGEKLHMYFSSRLCSASGLVGSYVPIFVETEYIFDNSATFTTRWSIKSLNGLKESELSLAWQAQNSAWEKIDMFRGEEKILNDSKQLPDTIVITGKDGNRMLTLSQLTMNPQLPDNNISAVKDKLSIVMFNGVVKSFQLGKWYQGSMAVTPGNNSPVKTPEISLLAENKIDDDLSFEHRGAIFSWLDNNLVPCQLPYVEPGSSWFTWQCGQLDTKIAHSGKVSLQMREIGMWFRQNLDINKLSRGKYRLSAFIKGGGLEAEQRFIDRNPESTLTVDFYYYDNVGKEYSLQKTIRTTGSFDWKEFSMDLEIPSDCFAPQIEFNVSNNGYGAKFWLDDITFINLTGQ